MSRAPGAKRRGTRGSRGPVQRQVLLAMQPVLGAGPGAERQSSHQDQWLLHRREDGVQCRNPSALGLRDGRVHPCDGEVHESVWGVHEVHEVSDQVVPESSRRPAGDHGRAESIHSGAAANHTQPRALAVKLVQSLIETEAKEEKVLGRLTRRSWKH